MDRSGEIWLKRKGARGMAGRGLERRGGDRLKWIGLEGSGLDRISLAEGERNITEGLEGQERLKRKGTSWKGKEMLNG